MGPRWKGKESEGKALGDPMSKLVAQLQSSLMESEASGLLSGCSVLLQVREDQVELLNHACFGRPIVTAEKDEHWVQLGMEEAFYLCYALKCITIIGGDGCLKSDDSLWKHMKCKKTMFPITYKAYSHLRAKNWVVRSGLQYGVDFVAYRHHPSLVHSEYGVLILSDNGEEGLNDRMRAWSDIHCTTRLCGSVAKTLLLLHVNIKGCGSVSLADLDNYSINERVIKRWSPEQCRENQTEVEHGSK